MATLLFVISFLIMLAIQWGTMFIPQFLNGPYRARQYAFPMICLLVSMVLMYFSDSIVQAIVFMFSWLADQLAQVPMFGQYLSGLFGILANNIVTNTGSFVTANMIIVIVWILIKKYLGHIVANYWTNQDLFQDTSAYFYRVDEHALIHHGHPEERYELKPKFRKVRTMIWAAFLGCFCLYALVLLEVMTLPAGSAVPAVIAPSIGVLVLGEIYCFLNGKIPHPARKDHGQEDDLDADCETIRKDLKERFGDRLCYDDVLKEKKVARSDDIYVDEEQSGEGIEELATTYFIQLKELGIPLHPDYQKASRQLLNQESLVIMNPFYRDLTYYLMLPMVHSLLKNRKILVVCGRGSDKDDIKEWIQQGFLEVTNLKRLWITEDLNEKKDSEDISVGIISFQDVYNQAFIQNNRPFLSQVRFVLMLEPSNMIGTGQIGLRNILQICEMEEERITYCILDRSVDGLIDSLSHLVHQPLTQVFAPPAAEAGSCRAFWHVDGPGMQNRIVPGISRYLGMGTEIAMEAISLGAKPVHWFSSEKAPLADVKWNISQYYPSFCEYTNTVLEQNQLEERLTCHSHLWQAQEMQQGFLVVEDEFCNAFDMARLFSSRLLGKGFVNILSESYMLRDYMIANPVVFTVDSKAIPTIVPDYARTERNFIIRTLLLLSMGPVDESWISNQLSIHGIESRKTAEKLVELIEKHTGIPDFFIQTTAVTSFRIDVQSTRYQYSITPDQLNGVYDAALKSVYFVIENEKMDEYPMGNRLLGQIEQVLLPGQFFTWDGRYYQVVSISQDSRIIVRRAAEHFSRRRYYRQLRDYLLAGIKLMDEERYFRNIRMKNGFANIHIETDAYLDMDSLSDLENAAYCAVSPRSVRNLYQKEFLQLRFEGISPEVLFTIALLLNEIFRTLYPTETGYLVAVPGTIPAAVRNLSTYQTRLRAVVPSLSSEEELDPCAIYILEDSHLDLGLLVSVERNMQRILEIVADYLAWQLEEEKASEEPEEVQVEKPASFTPASSSDLKQEQTSYSIFGNWGKKKKKKKEEEEASKEEKPEESGTQEDAAKPQAGGQPESAQSGPAEPEAGSSSAEQPSGADASDEGVPGPSSPQIEIFGEDEELIEEEREIFTQKPYLYFGQNAIPSYLALNETYEYLKGLHFNSSSLHDARVSKAQFDAGSTYDPRIPGTHYCDFCGNVLEPGHYDVLKDGRERCPVCSSEAVRSRFQFRRIVKQTMQEMEAIFGISFTSKIQFHMANAKKVNQHFGGFTPTPEFDARAIGYATRKNGHNDIYIENGAPLWSVKTTIVHELTHIWQFENWNEKTVGSAYNDPQLLLILEEGMAVWSEVQYLVSMEETERAIRYSENRKLTEDEYGTGYKLYLANYAILEQNQLGGAKTPFHTFPPIPYAKEDEERQADEKHPQTEADQKPDQ